MQLYIVSILSLLVSILLFGLFYLYKQFNSLLVKVNQLTFELNNSKSKTNETDPLSNVFSNPDLMSSFLNSNDILGDDDDLEGEDEELDDDDDDLEGEDEDLDDDDLEGEDEELEDLDDDLDDLDDELEGEDEDLDDEEVELDDEEVELDNEEVFLNDDEETNVQEEDEEVLFDENNDNTKVINMEKTSNNKKRSAPNEQAKDYDVGHVVLSENDNNKYEVIANKNGVKRWKKIKQE